MKEAQLASILHDIAVEEVPDSLNLQPLTIARATQIRKISRLQLSPWPVRAFSHSGMTLRTGLLVLAVAAIIATPAITTAGQHILQQFGLILIERTQLFTTQEQGGANSSGITAAPAEVPPAPQPEFVSLDVARGQLTFPLPVPAWVPDGLELRGALVGVPYSDASKPPMSVTVVYDKVAARPGAQDSQLALEVAHGSMLPAYLVSNSRAAETTVGGRPAIYVQGRWGLAADGITVEWDPQADSSMLSWEQDGLTYVLRASGMALTIDDLVRIAESLK